MPQFTPGLTLAHKFFTEAIQPLMDNHFPHLPYSAARLDWGSDTLGFDTPMSMDHGWGPRMTIFLSEADFSAMEQDLNGFFAYHLPFSVQGFPIHFDEPYADGGRMQAKTTYPIHHMITITTPEKFLAEYIGVEIHQTISPLDWLTIPQQRLLTVRKGQIYHDGLNVLTKTQKQLNWYPHDLWLYLMASQWQRIDQEEPFMGHTGSVDDDLGSRLIASRLIRDVMKLVFLIERQYAPYSKWFGSAFNQLNHAASLSPLFYAILDSQDWKTQESHFSEVYRILIDAHNALEITPPISPDITNFHGRPFLVPHSARFVQALQAQIQEPEILKLPPSIGSIDQIVDTTDVLENLALSKKISAIYQDSD